MKTAYTCILLWILCFLGLSTSALADTMATPGVAWTFTSDKFNPSVSVGSPLTADTAYTIQSNTSGMTTIYTAGSGDYVGTLSSIPGYTHALYFGGNTQSGAGAQGYFKIPITQSSSKGDGILTIVGSNKGWWGALKVHTGLDAGGNFQGWVGMVEMPQHAEVSIKLNIADYVDALYITTENVQYIASVTWIPEGGTSGGQTPTTYTLTYDANGATSGSVPAAVSGIPYSWVAVAGNTGLLAKANSFFDGWQDAAGNRYKQEWGSSVQMVSNLTLSAVWTHAAYTLTYGVEGGHGSLQLSEGNTPVASGASLASGAEITISAVPDQGYVLDYITLDGNHTQYVSGSTFIMPAKNTEVKAFFRAAPSDPSEGATEGTSVGDANTSSWLSAYSDFFTLTTDKEVELSFVTNATNEWYHSWVLQVTTDPSHHSPWDGQAYFTTTVRCDAVSGMRSNKPSFYEVKLYNLQTDQIFTNGNIPSSVYQDMKHAKVVMRLVTDGTNTYLHAQIASLDNGNRWLYTVACRTEQEQAPLYVSASVDNCYLTNFTGRLKNVYPILVNVNPVQLTEQADVRITTPEGVLLPNGIPAGVGDNLIISCAPIEGYTFAGWGSATSRTDNPLKLTIIESGEHISHAYTATYSNGSAPVISANVPEVVYLGGSTSYDFGVASNSVGTITASVADPSIATVAYSDDKVVNGEHMGHTLTITPLAAGETTITLQQAADAYHAVGSKEIQLRVAKRPTTITLSPSQYEMSASEQPDITQPTITVTCLDDNGQLQTLYTLQMGNSTIPDATAALFSVDSDDETVALCYENTIKHSIEVVVNRGQVSHIGSANIKVRFDGNDRYAAADPALFHVLIDAGVSSDKFADAAPGVNDVVHLMENTSSLVRYTFGGWKHNSHQFFDHATQQDVTDSWMMKDQNTFTPIDGYTICVSGANNAQDEAMMVAGVQYGAQRYGWFEQGKPYTLPVRGAYMTFEPQANGTLSIYLLQNGVWNRYTENTGTNMKGDIVRGIFHPHAFFIVDQNGTCVPSVTATSREVPNEAFTCTINKDAGGSYTDAIDNTSSNVARWADFRNYLSPAEQTRIQSAWGVGNLRGVQEPIQLDNGSWMVVEKGVVKYNFHVTAGETYYVFSNFSKLGFAGCNFVKDADQHLSSPLVLSDEVCYTAPDQKTQYETITINRSFTANQWSTITLPFYMRPDEVEAVFGQGTQLIIMDKATRLDENISFSFLYHEIQGIIAGYPYFIYPTQTVSGFSVHNKLIDPTLAQQQITSDAGYTFMGVSGYSTPLNTTTCESLVLKPGDLYLGTSSQDPAVSVLKNSIGLTRMKGFRTYIEAPAEPSEQAMSFDFFYENGAPDADAPQEDITTELMSISVDADAESDRLPAQGVYNVLGQRVDASLPLASGVYIVNGKKQIML